MIEGIGTDIIEIGRIKNAIDNHGVRFLDRIFTENEQKYCLAHKNSASHFAARFAAKEAIVKAFGTGLKCGVSWLDIEIVKNEYGAPSVILAGVLKTLADKKNLSVYLSLSHCREYATAFVVLNKGI